MCNNKITEIKMLEGYKANFELLNGENRTFTILKILDCENFLIKDDSGFVSIIPMSSILIINLGK